MVVNNYGGDEESTGSSGIAVLVVPREGEFVLSVRRSGHEPFEEPLTLPRGNSRREVELEPAPQPSLRVTLLSDPPGRSGRVLLYGDDLQARRYTAHEALFEDVPPGSYHVVFVVDGLGAAHDTVVVGETGETALALRLRRGGTLLVPVAGPGASRPRVVDAAGVDWDRIFRRLELPGQEIAQLEERPGIGPAWIFPALPPGTYTVSVEGVSRQPVRIEPGSVQTAW
jgi:hypothetical protein